MAGGARGGEVTIPRRGRSTERMQTRATVRQLHRRAASARSRPNTPAMDGRRSAVAGGMQARGLLPGFPKSCAAAWLAVRLLDSGGVRRAFALCSAPPPAAANPNLATPALGQPQRSTLAGPPAAQPAPRQRRHRRPRSRIT